MNVQLWYEQLGYMYNPFTIKPGFFDDEVYGYDDEIDSLVDELHKGNMFFLEGAYGLGKTTIIKFLINEFKDSKRVIHISRNRSDRSFNYSRLLKEASKGLSKLFGKKAKDTLLIVDETEKINAEDCKQILHYYNQGNFRSVLFVDQSLKEARISSDIKKMIGKNVVKLKNLDAKEAIALVRSRLEGNDEVISDDLVKKVFDKSAKNTRQFLINMEEVCRAAFADGRNHVSKDDLTVL